ncbi:hypothetical protein [Desulfosoma caldarium]|uniref:PXPV repeat-containing protein n=1 Tax=Desulfosoma caldarium TaxID=610254 RepID=A0A3N1UTY8_9BACT|nr:hypothetical protein [Desulfosoma caldarium]ROQ93178.1 hypothetical protein EDC27_1183 [Desulfosoma caldarium]
MTKKTKAWMIVFLVLALMAVGGVPKAQAHKPKHAKNYAYVPAPCPPPKTVVHHYYPYKPYRYAPPPPPRRVVVYHHYKSCYPSCGYYPAPRGPYVGGYVDNWGWSLIFKTGGRW